MTTKITITIERDAEAGGTPQGVHETAKLLEHLQPQLPIAKTVVSIECEDKDAQSWRDDVVTLLSARPVGIVVKVKRTTDEEVDRLTMQRITPLDVALRDQEPA
jgi:hypothetical protein